MSKGVSSRKSNRVKWVPDANLCQIRLFLSEDCPSQVGSKAEDHLQAKTSWMLHSDAMELDDAPPGFEGILKQSCIFQVNWKCPPTFMLNSEWRVAAGELSEESVTQKNREMRVLEAVYPRISSIPPSPSVSPDLVEDCKYNDHETTLIPVIPIEEGDDDLIDHESPPRPLPIDFKSTAMDQDVVSVPFNSNPTINDKSLGKSTGLQADITAAASAAFTAIMKSNEKGSMIDTDLLIKILSDPKMIDQLSKDFSSSTTSKVPPVFESKLSKTCPIQSLPNKSSLETPAILTKKLEDVNRLLQVLLSTPTTMSSLGSKMSIPTVTSSAPQSDSIISKKPMDKELEIPKKIPPFPGSDAKQSDLFAQPDRYIPQNPVNLGLECSQPSLKTTIPTPPASMLYREPLMSSKPEELFIGHRPDMVSLSSSMKTTPIVKDINYYKSLIKLHGMGGQDQESQEKYVPRFKSSENLVKLHGIARQETRENFTPQFKSRSSEVMKVSGERDSRAKIPKECKFHNSSKGCKKGSSCPFQHGSLLKLQVGIIPDRQNSKRIKLSREM